MTRYELEVVSRDDGGAPDAYRVNREGKRVGVIYRDGKRWQGCKVKKGLSDGPKLAHDELAPLFDQLIEELEKDA
jgi:hypothetical protein